MRRPFDSDYKQTQDFGNDLVINGKHIYAQFGLKGHNGIDYALPNGTKVLAPHDGKVIEATLDPKGYGIYVKIENSIEGSVLAHLREYRVGVGDGVKEGDLIGYSDNSGNSTGPHLHWGYYRFPRDRKNGFAGFIDQAPYFSINSQTDLQAELDKVRQARDSHWNDLVKVKDALGVLGEYSITTILARADQLSGLELQISKKDEEIAKLREEATSVQSQLNEALKVNTEAQKINGEHGQVIEVLKSENEDLKKKLKNSAKIIVGLGERIEELKASKPIEAYTPWQLIITGFLRLVRR